MFFVFQYASEHEIAKCFESLHFIVDDALVVSNFGFFPHLKHTHHHHGDLHQLISYNTTIFALDKLLLVSKLFFLAFVHPILSSKLLQMTTHDIDPLVLLAR